MSEGPQSRDVLEGPDLDGLENGEKIAHIVVLMLENRSFDHMLGYLSLPADAGGSARTDVDGLQVNERGEPAARFRNTHDGVEYPVFPLGSTAFTADDVPDHSGHGVDQQMRGGSHQGFVENFVETRNPGYPAERRGLVMGYYTGAELYAYDFLARNFCVCDRWFSSTPGSTMPNRLYAVAGRAAQSRNGSIPPVYAIQSIVRHLDDAGVGWRWFAHDPFASLWGIDIAYAVANVERALAHFQYFDEHAKVQTAETVHRIIASADKRGLAGVAEHLGHLIHPHDELVRLRLGSHEIHPGDTFASLAQRGALPPVSFIDPLFVDVGLQFNEVPQPVTNDDHPPSDVLHGQKLVADTVEALVESALWERTLLLVTYDEHGGFFDHVAPSEDVDDEDPDPQFHRLGPRVPALIVSPWVRKQSATKITYDHATLLKTILATFCLNPDDNSIPTMGNRVRQARHLLTQLSERNARPRSDLDGYDELKRPRERIGIASVRSSAPREGHTTEALTDWQKEYRLGRSAVATFLGLADPPSLERIDAPTLE